MLINTNDLVAKRIRELAAKMQQDEGTGFISGLAADKVEALVTDTGDGEENPQTSGNVIKAGEDLQKLKEEAEAEAQKIIEDAKAKAESILADARAQAEAQKADALEQARRQGQQEAKAEAERAEAQRAAEYQKKAAGLDAEYQKRMDELEPQFVDTITGIYEHIFDVDLHSYREVLCYLISATMRKTEDIAELCQIIMNHYGHHFADNVVHVLVRLSVVFCRHSMCTEKSGDNVYTLVLVIIKATHHPKLQELGFLVQTVAALSLSGSHSHSTHLLQKALRLAAQLDEITCTGSFHRIHCFCTTMSVQPCFHIYLLLLHTTNVSKPV